MLSGLPDLPVFSQFGGLGNFVVNTQPQPSGQAGSAPLLATSDTARALPSAPTPTAAARANASHFPSTCIRNFRKIEKLQREGDIFQYFASYDTALIDINNMMIQLMQPCAASDSAAAADMQLRQRTSEQIRSKCAGPHERYECARFGYANPTAAGVSSDVGNQNYFNWFSQQYSATMNNPNWRRTWTPTTANPRSARSPMNAPA